MMSEKENDGALWAELSTLKTQSAAQSTDIRGIYGAIDEIRDAFVRFQENARPNIGAMFLVLIATCTFLVTAGGLALMPLKREQAVALENARTDRIHILENRERLARMEGAVEEQRHRERVGAKQ